MKLIITSPDALIDKKTGTFFPGMTEALDQFLAQNKKNKIVVVSIRSQALTQIPKKYNPLQIAPQLRGGKVLIDHIAKQLKIEYSDLIVLGSKDHDLYTASNSKILLLSALYSKANNPDSKLFRNNYGIKIASPKELALFFERFSEMENPWYFRLEPEIDTTVYALTDANTMYKNYDEVALNDKFKAYLKSGQDEHKEPFTAYFLLSLYIIFREIGEVNYFGVFPTSSGKSNDDLDYFVRRARESFNVKNSQPLFVRVKPSAKRHMTSKEQRKADGSSSQFDTIIINPHYRGKLEGKTVCVIDDYTTYGSSSETVRHLLKAEKVKKIIFIALGKFGKEYIRYTYRIKGDVYDKYEHTLVKAESLNGDFNYSANREFISTFKDLK